MKKNIAEILKYCTEGLPLWSPAYGKVELKKATDTGVIIRTKCGYAQLNADGKIFDAGECILFPSEEQRDWDKFWPYEDGDVLYAKTKRNEHVFIYRDKVEEDCVYCYVNLSNRVRLLQDPDGHVCNKSEAEIIRYATEKEIDALHRAIEKEGRMWDPIKKEVVPVEKKLENIEIIAAEEKKEKFDINTLNPFDRVLVRDNDGQRWTGDLFLYKTVSSSYEGVHCLWDQCIPYEGNETLLGTTKQPDEYYITWEEEK